MIAIIVPIIYSLNFAEIANLYNAEWTEWLFVKLLAFFNTRYTFALHIPPFCSRTNISLNSQ